jgi:hypothetical protein
MPEVLKMEVFYAGFFSRFLERRSYALNWPPMAREHSARNARNFFLLCLQFVQHSLQLG